MALTQYQERRRLALFVLLIGAFLALLFVGSAWTEDVHETIEVAGLALIVVGIAGRIWCTLYIGGRKASEIVASGPYSISRNPLYVFSSIAAGGAGRAEVTVDGGGKSTAMPLSYSARNASERIRSFSR